MSSDTQHLEIFFMAMADITRLRLINIIRNDEVNVSVFTETLGESQPKISRHLAYLRSCGIVTTRREGKWIFYSISPFDEPEAEKVLNTTIDWMDKHAGLRNEYERSLLIRAENENAHLKEDPWVSYEDNAEAIESARENVNEHILFHNDLEEYLL